MDIHLPPELWIQISLFSSSLELSRLSRTSHYFLQLIRPLLYRKLTLGAKFTSQWDTTISLLISHPSPAKSVTSFRLYRRIPGILDVLANMSNLEHLLIDNGALFADAVEQNAFMEIAEKKEKPLQKLDIFCTILQTHHFTIPGLTSLVWRMNLSPQLWSVLESSRTTLKDIFIPLYVFPRHSLEDPFWKMRFPNLQCLKLFGWGCELFTEPPERAEFFKDHCDTLEEVNMDCYQGLGALSLSFVRRDNEDSAQLTIGYMKGAPKLILHVVENYARHLRCALTYVLITSNWEETSLSYKYTAQLMEVLRTISGNVACLPLDSMQKVALQTWSDELDDYQEIALEAFHE